MRPAAGTRKEPEDEHPSHERFSAAYADKHENLALTRDDDGVLVLRFHTDGSEQRQPLLPAHRTWSSASRPRRSTQVTPWASTRTITTFSQSLHRTTVPGPRR